VKVLSCFDGIACGFQALKNSGINVEEYYASEIDKHAIKIANKNHPEIIQLGDINNWKNWELPQIDLLIGGSPCQGFSDLGAYKNFSDERSKLFYQFVEILKTLRPKYFLLENVSMRKVWVKVITDLVGVEPIKINSSLVSGQFRERLYWTNIPNVKQPEDKHILLKDIIENGYVDREKSYAVLTSSSYRLSRYLNRRVGQIIYLEDKTREQVRADGDQVSWRKPTPIECERLQTLPDNYTESVSNNQRYKALGNCWTVDVISHIFSYLKDIEQQ
jgi:DNA (cytosine-5)-methyltransferase 3A